MNDNNVRLQNLRDFTVQIRCPSDDTIVGTGIVVSMAGKVVTCAHVVEAALGLHPREADGVEVGIYFPQARGGEKKNRRAMIAACCPEHDDDVVLLHLVDGPPPLGPEQIAILGTAELSDGHPFRSYGYRCLDSYLAGYADGKILGPVEPPLGHRLLTDPIQLKSSEINRGMSGAAVLDTERNLMVGIIHEFWMPDATTKDRDTAWAVDVQVLTFAPFSIDARATPLPLRAASQPKIDPKLALAMAASWPGTALHGAPPLLREWAGRVELLQYINTDWANPDHQITGLIGFGGEGKSSLARQWLENMLKDSSLPKPDGVFWWGFYDRRNTGEFFETALLYMTGGDSALLRQYPSASARAHLIAAMLSKGRYLFVLDGLEVMQYQQGDEYGLLINADLRQFLSYFAAPGHQSFCLITSRAPMLDLMEYTTYTHREVTRLSPADGRTLLQSIGVTGDDAALDRVVADWDGHALTLSLLGAFLVERYGGDIERVSEISPPTAEEPRYERVYRVLRRYDEHLSEAERAFLMLFSVFRAPVKETVFERVFRAGWGADALNAPIAALDSVSFKALTERLVSCRILRYNPQADYYTTHPIIRAYYSMRLGMMRPAQVHSMHRHIKDFYLNLAGKMRPSPSLDDLAPLIEAVYHSCQAEDHQDAWGLFSLHLDQGHGTDRVLVYSLGAWETAFALILEFFCEGNLAELSLVDDKRLMSDILNAAGFYLLNLGRLHEAEPLFTRSLMAMSDLGSTEKKDKHFTGIIYRNLVELYLCLGFLDRGQEMAFRALELDLDTQNYERELQSRTYLGWTAYLRGNLEESARYFQEADKLRAIVHPQTRYLDGIRGIYYADYLQGIEKPDNARLVTQANLDTCRTRRWINQESRCYRLLGDLEAADDRSTNAGQYYAEALKIARSTSYRPALIEVLKARGRWAARHLQDTLAAFGDLNEALSYAVHDGYRIYEADIRVGLAWIHLATGDLSAARAEAEYSHRMSSEMGYYWGKVDAEEVLAALAQG
jgi:tetratricopeptide (TPR) repeat protein